MVQERGRAGDGRGVELPGGQLQGAGRRRQPAGREATPAQLTPPPTRLHLQASAHSWNFSFDNLGGVKFSLVLQYLQGRQIRI